MFDLHEIARIAQGEMISFYREEKITHFFTDSRNAISRPDAAFVAFRGQQHNGHDYVRGLFENGTRNFIVEEPLDFLSILNGQANVILVESSMDALQQIAKAHREKFQIPIIAVTGSNGKTIVKEWLSQILSAAYSVAKSPKSYNSQLGVPLSLLQISEGHEVAVIEAGISKKGEMSRLQRMIKPEIGIFTNIGPSHDEGFADRKEKVLEKWALFKDSRMVVYRKDHQPIDQWCPKSTSEILTWGFHPESTAHITNRTQAADRTALEFTYLGGAYHFDLPFIDEASFENAMHCICAALYLNIPQAAIQRQLNLIRKIEMRLELKQGINGCYIIDDTYNNDLAGLAIALEFMNQQQGYEKKNAHPVRYTSIRYS